MKRVASVLLLAVLLPFPSSAHAVARPGLCFGQEPTIRGTGYVVGTAGPDVIVTTGAAEVHALGGDDRVCGAFLVYGGAGDDRVRYTRADGDYPELDGGPGDDVLLLGGNRFGHVRGGGGDDVLRSGGGEQFLHGGPGRDRISGGPGPDTIIGAGGADVADGGRGQDSCSAETVRRC